MTLTPRESIKITRFGLTNTYRLLKSGEMPSIRIGKRFYIPKAALLKWLESAEPPITAVPRDLTVGQVHIIETAERSPERRMELARALRAALDATDTARVMALARQMVGQ